MTWFAAYIAVAWLLRMAMVPVILRRHFAPGASLAWLGIIFLHPYIGSILYLFLGEARLGPRRVERHTELVARYRPARMAVSEVAAELSQRLEPVARQAQSISGLPVMAGNRVDFLPTATSFVDQLIADIDGAKSHVHLLYYIFFPDATGLRVADALRRAATRGVTCRLLVDAVASRTFFKKGGLGASLTKSGVHVAAALPAYFFQRRLPRMDLRNHRKLALIDDQVAYAGSHNVINPTYGGRKGNPWIDITGRISGPVVAELAGVFTEDWAFETDEVLTIPSPEEIQVQSEDQPLTAIQVVPTGPVDPDATYRRVLLAAVQAARHELILTTPYFVPDEPTLVALMMAADRGVKVQLILPRTPDHFFTAAAGRAHFTRLADAGVELYFYRPGLIHSKTVTVDSELAVLGSANLDVRSFNLNFELTMLLYGSEPARRLRAIQHTYLADATPLDREAFGQRSVLKRYADSAISLLSPLL